MVVLRPAAARRGSAGKGKVGREPCHDSSNHWNIAGCSPLPRLPTLRLANPLNHGSSVLVANGGTLLASVGVANLADLVAIYTVKINADGSASFTRSSNG
jgi:hypothetical protein